MTSLSTVPTPLGSKVDAFGDLMRNDQYHGSSPPVS
ncbi:hypothetical protein H4W31_006142 [Plantactinospora soyae]|uniref:Uncharacterized protein n=1 Tax=Plantactinospora soyae TaxID=1544732 RepID=A0A927M9V0_9ACTN|nr:hypothetical protein [Plantactinospora soyae]